MQLLETKNITKKFINKKALDNLSLSIEQGKIYGLLGPNGSGKTTFMKMIAGLSYPTSGDIEINNEKVGTNTKKIVSYMPTSNHIPKWMRIKQCIKYYEDMYSDFDKNKASEMINFMGLNIEQKISDLSTGMLGRLKLSLTLSRNSKLYILDEPLNGIDPISREKIMESILNICDEETTIIISSHLVKELETIIDEAIFIDKGTVALRGNAEELRIERNMSIDEIYREVYKDV